VVEESADAPPRALPVLQARTSAAAARPAPVEEPARQEPCRWNEYAISQISEACVKSQIESSIPTHVHLASHHPATLWKRWLPEFLHGPVRLLSSLAMLGWCF
jgi:hypothetical protein